MYIPGNTILMSASTTVTVAANGTEYALGGNEKWYWLIDVTDATSGQVSLYLEWVSDRDSKYYPIANKVVNATGQYVVSVERPPSGTYRVRYTVSGATNMTMATWIRTEG